MGSAGMQGDYAALPEGDLNVPQPCLPHLSLYSPDPFPLLLSRSVFFLGPFSLETMPNAILK